MAPTECALDPAACVRRQDVARLSGSACDAVVARLLVDATSTVRPCGDGTRTRHARHAVVDPRLVHCRSSSRHALQCADYPRCRVHAAPVTADAAKVTTIDVLKIDVEGAELSVLHGIAPRHWKLVQQVVLEVETFAAVAAVSDILRANGFDVSSFASEREGKPDITSEVR